MYQQPPPYPMVGNGRPPRKAPRYSGDQYYYEERRGGGNCCLRFICCCYCFLFIVIILVVACGFYFYTFYKPDLPKYNFQSLQTKEFGYQPDLSLTTDIIVTIKAENPNKAIGFIYGKDSSVNVTYSDSTICSGTLPSFHQGHENTTIIEVELKGKSQFGSGIYEAFQNNEKSGRIPLMAKIRVPVQIVVFDKRFSQFHVLVSCSFAVSNLKPGKNVDVTDNKCDFSLTA